MVEKLGVNTKANADDNENSAKESVREVGAFV